MRKLICFAMGLLLLVGTSACVGTGPDSDIDKTLLYGTWQEGSVYERYYATPIDFRLPNGNTVQVNGTTWDAADDISEEEAQAFNWTLTGSTMVHEHVGTFITVPKVYTINTLTSNQLTYSDNYGRTHYYSKIR